MNMIQGRRFYEQDAAGSQAIGTIQVLPGEFQAILAGGLSTIADAKYKTRERMKSLKSMGNEKVLALYKSKGKNRDYDAIPNMHQAINDLLILEPEERLFVSRQTLEMVGCVEDYLRVCKANTLPPNATGVEKIRDIYVHFGKGESQKFLQTVDAEFKRLLAAQKIQASQGDMKISGLGDSPRKEHS